MNKIILKIILIVIISILLSVNCNAQTNETSVNKLYNEFIKIINSKKNQDIAIDQAIEILNKEPEAIEAYRVLTIIRDVEVTNELRQKYNSLFSKYFSELNDINSKTAEKLILIRLILMCFYNFKSYEEVREKDKICDEILIKMKNECNNKSFSALALQILFLNQQKGEDYMREFINDYPNHPALPYVELELYIVNCWINNEPTKGLEEAQKILKKYSTVITPDGPRFALSVYGFMSTFYARLKDYNNAIKYFNLIKDECPTHPDLPEIEKEINEIK
ncbi:MAG TPA: hypothetical protein DDW90_05690 [Cyanobacteria bacterium UBA9971]|nr:hypothetical protein [Cyanobacteria bacterium UBA9971]